MSTDTQPAAQAVEALIHQYGRLVFQVIYGLTGDWHESQDLTQDTFLTAFKAIEAARQASGANFQAKAWLLQIAARSGGAASCALSHSLPCTRRNRKSVMACWWMGVPLPCNLPGMAWDMWWRTRLIV